MIDEFSVITIGTFAPGGAGAYRHWGVPRELADQVATLIGRPADQESMQTADELEASNALVAGFETPPLIRRDIAELPDDGTTEP